VTNSKPSHLDPRLNVARLDLAAEKLRGTVKAARFAAGVLHRIVAPSAPLRRRPEPDAPLETEALHGEAANVYDEADGWSWAQLVRDSYVGYLPTSTLGPWTAPTHRLAALRTHAYPGPSIKLPPRFAISLGAWLSIERTEGDFAIANDGMHYFTRHLAPATSWEPDFVAVAERFLEAPYLWGGRSSEGLDCSGLIQAALTAAGVAAPRDSDMLEAELGSSLPPASLEGLRRGDLMFWKGHVGVMRDAATLLHASGWHMKVVSESLREAVARIAANSGGPITSIRRL
jgi:hypothetical protein